MKTGIRYCLWFLRLMVISISTLLAQQKNTLAVMDFDGFGMNQYEAQTLTDRLRIVAVEIGAYIIVERGAMEEILAEQGFQQSGCTSDECIVEVGELMGVQYMLGGTIGKVGNTFTVSMRIIDVETATVVKTASYDMTGEIDGLLTQGMRAAAKLIFGVEDIAPVRVVEQSSVVVHSNPPGAAVWLNGEEKGLTPASLKDLEPGSSYDLQVALLNYTPVNRTFTLQPGGNPPLRFELAREQGWLSIAGSPTGSGVMLGKRKIGTLPLSRSQYPTGKYELKVQKPGYYISKQPLELSTRSEAALTVNLEPKSKLRAMLFSTVLPGSGQVYEGSPLKGLVFLAATAGAGYLAWSEYSSFLTTRQQYEDDLELYNTEGDPQLFKSRRQVVNSSFQLMKDSEDKIRTLTGVLGAVWTLNLVEVIF